MTLATEHAWLQRASCGAGCVHAGADAPGARWVVVCRIALRTAAALTESGSLISVAGGGDTVAALAHAGAKDDFTFVSTAGGAFLEWMEGKDLPGVAALRT